eukprot:GHVL01003496.1.p1 GENE.GHVL01003496.1~~GHVL01003496.1.p1  ORF type:complete len:253 (+),score=29.46 GHVL01003496.1:106-864(+)
MATRSPESRIFVTKLPFDLSSDDLKQFFEQFGEVVDAYVPKNPLSTLNKGFGFVSFANPASVHQVTEVPCHMIKGRQVVVDRASARGDGQRQARSTTPGGSPTGRNEWNNYDQATYYGASYTYYPQGGMSVGGLSVGPPRGLIPNLRGVPAYGHDHCSRARMASPLKVFVGRISYESTTESLWSYFSQFGNVTDAYIPRKHDTGKSRGFGFVTFADEESLAKCFTQQEHFIDGRQVALDYADPNKQSIDIYI